MFLRSQMLLCSLQKALGGGLRRQRNLCNDYKGIVMITIAPAVTTTTAALLGQNVPRRLCALQIIID